jgi:hypothetical protein
MIMSPRLRKLMLTAHVVSSVGWLGAVATFLALGITAVTSQDIPLVRAAYLMMELTGRFVLVPFSLVSLITGIIQSLGTKWGLFRHYWILAKLVINVVASIILLIYMQTLTYLGGVAAQPTWSSADLAILRTPTTILHSSAGLVLLLVAAILSVYKPRGVTPYGWRKQHEERAALTQKGVGLSERL